MNRQSLRRRATADPSALPTDMPPLLKQLYSGRGITCPDELQRGLAGLCDYRQLQGIAEAVALLQQALEQSWFILVVGDFDVDGATSTVLMLLALRRMGAQRLDYLVPSRFAQGYGLTEAVVEQAQARGAELLITVDNGIASHAGVALARRLGMRVLITDHHLPTGELPAAHVIVNPNLPNCPFPSKVLAGVGVALYVMIALRAQLRQVQWFRRSSLPEPNLAALLDLVALGTVADVVPLDTNNRILVHQGICRIRAGHCRPGISALLAAAQRDPTHLVASDLGFVLGPRLNAAGRLEDMSLGIELLLCEQTSQINEMAEQLEALNNTRRSLEQGMQQEALGLCQQLTLDQPALPVGLALYHHKWHQGVVGIVASRLKAQFNRPVIAFAPAANGSLKGSGRSVPGLHLRDLLLQLDRQHPTLMESFGGHAMAVGLSIAEQQFNRFRQVFAELVGQHLPASHLQGEIWTDGHLPTEAFTVETATLLHEAGPWGQGFPEPLFDGMFQLQRQQLLKEKHLKMVVTPPNGAAPLEAIAFNVDTAQWPNHNVQGVQLVYRLEINRFRGNTTLQLLVEHLWPAILNDDQASLVPRSPPHNLALPP